MFAFLYNFTICIQRHQIIFSINQPQCCLIKIQSDNTTFIINRSCCTILNRLRHIIDIDIIAKDLPRTTVFCRNRCSCKTNICSIRQCITNKSSCTNNTFCYFLTRFILCNLNFFSKSILPSMCFIRHNYNIMTFR